MYRPDKLAPTPDAARPLTPDLDGLVWFLESQNGATTYDWYNTHNCVCCHFYQSLGFKSPWNNPLTTYAELFPSVEVYRAIGGTLPWTYAAVLERIRYGASLT